MTENTIYGFIKDFSLPIPVYSPEFIEEYIDLYDTLLDTKTKWNMLEDAVHKCSSEEAFNEYKKSIIAKVIDSINANEAYKQLNDSEYINITFPIDNNINGVTYTKSVQLYEPQNSNNYYISIDLKTANYQALKYFDSKIVNNTNTYDEFIRQFTDIEYLCKSKPIRQVIFGKLNMNRIAHIERYMISNVLKYLLENNIFFAENVVTYTTDELIIKCDKDTALDIINLQKDILDKTGAVVSIDKFMLLYIGNNGYVKVHQNKPDTFKGVPSTYFAQAYCAYMKINPMPEIAMYFTYEKQLARFVKPMAWKNV